MLLIQTASAVRLCVPLALPEQVGHVDHPLLPNVLVNCLNHQDDIGVVYMMGG